jgi:hypothetical protein
VSLVAEGKVDEFIQKVKTSYLPYKDLEGTALSEVIFATKPGSGACGQSESNLLCVRYDFRYANYFF